MLDVCPMWYLGFSMFLGVLIAVFVYYVIVLRNFFMKAVMHKPEGYVSLSFWSSKSTTNDLFRFRVINKLFTKHTRRMMSSWKLMMSSFLSRVFRILNFRKLGIIQNMFSKQNSKHGICKQPWLTFSHCLSTLNRKCF